MKIFLPVLAVCSLIAGLICTSAGCNDASNSISSSSRNDPATVAQTDSSATEQQSVIAEPADPVSNNDDQPLVPNSAEDIAATQLAAEAAANDAGATPQQAREMREAALRPSIGEFSPGEQPVETTPEIDPNKVVDLTFDDIKFEMEKGEPFVRTMLTEDIRKLHKQNIRIKGFIKPADRQTGLKSFVFVRDDKECCFGPTAALFDCILVSLGENETTDFTTRPVSVEGLFYVKEYKGPNGQIWAIYRMRNGKVN